MSKRRWVTGRSWGMGAAMVPPSGPGGGGEEARAPAGRPGLRTRTPGLPGRSAHARPGPPAKPRASGFAECAPGAGPASAHVRAWAGSSLGV